MKDHLSAEWKLVGQKLVLHDRPPAHFGRLSSSEIHDLFLHLEPTLKTMHLESFLPFNEQNTTPFTVASPQGTSEPHFNKEPTPSVHPREDRPALIVSSTSWTADEDFSLLLKALSIYEKSASLEAAQNPSCT